MKIIIDTKVLHIRIKIQNNPNTIFITHFSSSNKNQSYYIIANSFICFWGWFSLLLPQDVIKNPFLLKRDPGTVEICLLVELSSFQLFEPFHTRIAKTMILNRKGKH
jgi:hypothetical protein